MKILVAYDGSLHSKTALRYGIQKVRENGGEVVVLSVFPSSMFIDYDVPKAEEMARAEATRYVEDAKKMIQETGHDLLSRIIVEEGNPVEEIVRYARTEDADIIFSPPNLKSIIKNAPCPVSIIPGYILFPLDNTDIPMATIEKIIREVTATGSTVILLGIVPVHIYGRWEREEIKKITKETSLLLKRIKKMLNAKKIETKEIMRSGYPDEEIVKVSDEYPVSMIIMPEEGNTPSELSKAAAILSDRESGLINKPLVLMPTIS